MLFAHSTITTHFKPVLLKMKTDADADVRFYALEAIQGTYTYEIY